MQQHLEIAIVDPGSLLGRQQRHLRYKEVCSWSNFDQFCALMMLDRDAMEERLKASRGVVPPPMKQDRATLRQAVAEAWQEHLSLPPTRVEAMWRKESLQNCHSVNDIMRWFNKTLCSERYTPNQKVEDFYARVTEMLEQADPGSSDREAILSLIRAGPTL